MSRNAKKKPKNKGRRMVTFLFVLLFLIVFLYLQNAYVGLSSYTYENAQIPAAFDGYRILQVSDVHSGTFMNFMSLVKATKPDCIFITGDMLDRNTKDLDIVEGYIDELTALAPVYFVTGNHEIGCKVYKEFRQYMQDSGVEVLENRRTTLEKDGEQIAVIGLHDYLNFGSNARFADTLDSLMLGYRDPFTILLSHRPEKIEIYKKTDVDLVFSGHAHGGQIRLPFIGGLIAPGQFLFPKYTAGLITEGSLSMAISRGLGNSSRFPQRVFNRPELVLVTLKTGE